MASETRHYALILSLAIALLQSAVPLLGARRRDPAAMEFAGHAALGQLALIALAFGCLT
jgi:cytochrome c-type biogenesis protein CcmF